ncbi:MAG: STAS domain-containing protein [Polyangiaceae bacterium]
MIVTLPPELTIAHAAEWKPPLLEAIASGEGVLLDAKAVLKADIAGLQLLIAAKRSALAAGVRFGFLAGARSEALDRTAGLAGLVSGSDAPEELLWRETYHD